MGFNSFRVNVVLRVLFLLCNVLVLAWGIVRTDWQMTLVVSVILLVLQMMELVHYVETTNRHFATFIDSIAADDFSIRYNP